MRTDKPALRESFGKRPEAARQVRMIQLLEQLLVEQQQTNQLLMQQMQQRVR
jgi:hypothetical protein